ncbi:S-layer homology domain-containing protein [Lysinibacillus sp. BW-2-10]|uniref:S-layer homology domain-containing protein n=1 Tax=Lysinibacillus sp. BW-2-10 TaxID=2590030 RepID=UPI001180F4DA|nr:S-layer homology domain-containing protein [Lysinibacillus sp. BW-2-10]TSI07011.1 S-layer homology domain-containing protein [Lysinibacillus sp. BW-2-10]
MTNNKTKKYFKAGLAAAVVVSSGVAAAPMATQAQSNETISFTDLKNDHLFYNDIMNLVERGIVVGFPDRTFGAEKQVTRGQAAVILAKILNLDTVNVTDPGFIDVPKDHRYYGAIAALANADIIVGYNNKYNADAPLTRNAMAKIIALGFGLKSTETAPFKDMDHLYKDYISAMYENGITLGKSETVYDGKSLVSRGQMAAFAVRADKIERNITFEVSNIENAKIVTSKGDFKSELSIFNVENAAALEGAEVSAIIANGEIKSITSLTLNNSGTQENPVTFDGGNIIVDGPLTVNADYVAVKNVTVNKDVTLTSKVENDFTAEGLNTNGELIIEDAKAPVASMTMMVANVNTNGPKVNLANSSVKAINAQRNNIVIASDKKIPELKVASNVATIKVDAAVASVSVNGSESLQITGTGSIDKVNVVQATQLALDVKGQVKELVVSNKDAKVTIGAEAKIEKLVVPADSDLSTVIENYETVKDSITEVVDEAGTVVVPPVTGGGNENPATPLTLDVKGLAANDGTASVNLSGAGTSASPYVLTADPAKEGYVLQFAANSTSNVNLAAEGIGLKLVDSTLTDEQKTQLQNYYASKPEAYAQYLAGALAGTNPFAVIKNDADKGLVLYDGAKLDGGSENADLGMLIPGDFPAGTYTLEGQVGDQTFTYVLKVENPATVMEDESVASTTLNMDENFIIEDGIVKLV